MLTAACSVYPSLSEDKNSLHASCPVIRGEKWTATKWCAALAIPRAVLPLRIIGGAPPCRRQSKLSELLFTVFRLASLFRLHVEAFPHPSPRWPNACEDRDKECPKARLAPARAGELASSRCALLPLPPLLLTGLCVRGFLLGAVGGEGGVQEQLAFHGWGRGLRRDVHQELLRPDPARGAEGRVHGHVREPLIVGAGWVGSGGTAMLRQRRQRWRRRLRCRLAAAMRWTVGGSPALLRAAERGVRPPRSRGATPKQCQWQRQREVVQAALGTRQFVISQRNREARGWADCIVRNFSAAAVTRRLMLRLLPSQPDLGHINSPCIDMTKAHSPQ